MQHFAGSLTATDSFTATRSNPGQTRPLASLSSSSGATSTSDASGVQTLIVGNCFWKSAELTKIAKTESHEVAALRAYQEHGDEVSTQLSGHFALVILDQPRKKVLLAVDHFCTIPIYYAETKTGFFFATSISDVLQTASLPAQVERQSLFNYLYFHCVPGPESAYRAIQKVRPASYVTFSDHGVKTNKYWLPDFQSEDMPPKEWADALKSRLRDAVQRCDPSDRTGAFLSGGLDSSTISGVLRENCPTARAFSIGFDEPGYDEMEYARLAAKHFDIELIEYYVTAADVADAFPLIASAYEEPFGNSSAIPTYFCAKLAKQHGVDKLLAGDGGDELFAGNTRYRKQQIFDYYSRVPAFLRSDVLEPLMLKLPTRALVPGKLKSYVRQAKIPMPDRLETYNLLEREDLNSIFQKDFLQQIDQTKPKQLHQFVFQEPEQASLLDRMLYLDWHFTLADNDLRKVTRMCEVGGVDVYYPMLDTELLLFSCTIAPDIKLKGNNLRHFFKNSLSDFLPREVITKTKHGFGLPFGPWLKKSSQLQEIFGENLRSLKERGIFQDDYIDRLSHAHRTEHAGYFGNMVWVLGMLEQWLTSHEIELV